MSDSANTFECIIEDEMRLRIRGRIEFTFNHFSIHVLNNHILRPHLAVVHTAWLYGDHAMTAVCRTDIAECMNYQPLLE